MLSQVPDADGSVLAGRGELGPVRTERDTKDPAGVSAKDLQGGVTPRAGACSGLTSQIRIVPSCPAEASLVPSGLKATSAAQPSWPRKACCNLPRVRSQTLIWPSMPAVTANPLDRRTHHEILHPGHGCGGTSDRGGVPDR